MNKPSSKKRGAHVRSLASDAATYGLDLVTTVTRELMTCSSREEILGRLPRLLEHNGETQVSLWQQQGKAYAEVRGSSLQPIKLALHEKLIEEVISTREPSWFNQPSASKTVSATALPLFEGEELLVVLKLERDFPFDDREYKNLIWLASTVSCLLTTVAERMKSAVITQLSQVLVTARDTTTMAERTLELLSAALNIESGALLVQQGSSIYALASVGTLPEISSQPSLVTTPWLEEAHKHGKPSYYPSLAYQEPSVIDTKLVSFIAYPIGETLPARYVLFLGSSKVRWWLQTEKDLLASVVCALSLAFNSTVSQTCLQTLLTLENHSLTESDDSLLHEVVRAAVQNVPGAEAGRLLIYQGKKFYFRAAVGYDLSALQHLSLRAMDIQAWPQPAQLAWDSSEPRIFSLGEQKQMLEGSTLPDGRDIKATLYFPIVQQDKVLAILMLDNFTDPEAFAFDSLEAVRMFASPIALSLRERRYRHLLEKVALTDPLTNLDNRTSFNQLVAREVARSQRYASPFSLLIIAIGTFKNPNDTSARARSDAMLVEVARTLKKVMRPSDSLFRWSEDEFAAILPNTAYDGGVVAARRCARAIKRIPEETLPMSIHIGVASFPKCATNTTSLIDLASERLAKGKAHDITVFLAEKLSTLEE